MDVAALDKGSWSAFESTLALRLGQVGDGEFVSVADDRFVPEPAPGAACGPPVRR